MKSLQWPQKLTVATVLSVAALAQTPRAGESSLELEPSLFVQLPGGKSTPGAVQLVWIPGTARKILPRENPRPMRVHGFLHSHYDQERLHVPEPGRGSGALARLSFGHASQAHAQRRPLSCPNERLGRTTRLYRARTQGPARTFLPIGANQGQSHIHPNTGRRWISSARNPVRPETLTDQSRLTRRIDLPSRLGRGQSPRNDTSCAWRRYASINPDSKHFRTDSQSESERRPINRTSRCGRVTRNNLKYDTLCNPACLQSSKAQSVGTKKSGARDVIKPTITSGRFRW
jgi:hypothetical protein